MENQAKSEEHDLPRICTYCGKWVSGPKTGACSLTATDAANISHGICPDCLLANFPNEYLAIQKERRLRIKYLYRNGYPDTNVNLLEASTAKKW